MTWLTALLVGVLYAVASYLMMRRSVVKLIFGLLLLGTATNLLIFVCARLVPGRAAIVPPAATRLAAPFADPLGQAIILTAIVISFGVLAFAMVLVKRTYQAVADDDTDVLAEDGS